MTVTYRRAFGSADLTARRTTRGIHSETLTRISKANKRTSNDFVLITQRGSTMCTFAAFFWNYLNYPATIWHLLKKGDFSIMQQPVFPFRTLLNYNSKIFSA